MGVKLAAASGGSIELVPTNTASAFTVTVPAVTATVLTDSAGILNIGSGQIYKDASGNLLVGGTTAKGKNYTFQGSNSIGIGVETTVGGYTSTAFQTAVYGTIAGAGFYHIACLNSGAQTMFAVRGDGYVYTPNLGAATGTTVVLNANGFLYTLTSSIRYKKDVTPIDIGLDFILSLNPVKYNLIETDEPQVGFIAEDFPDSRLVSMSRVDKRDDSKGLQAESVNYAQIVAPLVKAIQEQQALIVQLQADVAALKGAQA